MRKKICTIAVCVMMILIIMPTGYLRKPMTGLMMQIIELCKAQTKT